MQRRRLPFALLVLTAVAGPVHAQVWTDWTSADQPAGTAAGNLTFGGGTVDVDYTGEIYFAQATTCGEDFWRSGGTPRPAYTDGGLSAPTGCDMIAITGGANRTYTLSFSSPLVDPFMAFVSIGQPGFAVNYDFSAPFDIVSQGPGRWGSGPLNELPGDVLQGLEGHGTIQFQGTYSQITWTAAPSETWHGFTVGAAALGTNTVPEPMSMALLGTGLAGLGALRWRRRKKNEAA